MLNLRRSFSALAVSLLFAQTAAARIALVIGNSAYPQSPLENPVNDARGMAKALQESGFEVELLVDQKRESMRASIVKFGAKLSAKKQPSVFYFAGHAIQLDWRNYLLPTDIAIRRPEDVSAQAIDLGDLLAQLGQATVSNGGASNIVILDACRDNPFGKTVNALGGLTQIDAPIGTLLAYATAPGNVAQDAGVGANGLYTENLLREMRVEGAKIEDVLKRVRLSVRLKSAGQQIPWESTSLEDDFYFHVPRTVVKLSRAEAEKAFEEELTAWTTARSATSIAVIEDYMRRYPSGKFSELAQYRLDALLAAQPKPIVPQALVAQPALPAQLTVTTQTVVVAAPLVSLVSTMPASPGSVAEILASAMELAKGMSQPDNFPPAKPGEIRQGWQVGDLMVYQETPLAGLFKFASTVRQRAWEVTSTQVGMRSGLILDPFSYPKGSARGVTNSSDAQMLIHDYQVGKKWSTRFRRGGNNGTFWVEADAKVLSRETLDTPAGRFETFKVVIKAEDVDGPGYQYNETWWIDMASLKPIAYEKLETEKDGRVRDHRKGQLITFENDGRPDKD
jgi:uncharacterized caspase-like protein